VSGSVPSDRNLSRPTAAAAAVTLAGFLGVLWWLCACDSRIAFLDRHPPAEWIVFPKPPDGQVHNDGEVSAVFRRSFTVAEVPGAAALKIRAFGRASMKLNGAALEASDEGPNWKDAASCEVARALRRGTNDLEVTVTNTHGPPALWLSLEWGAGRVDSDTDWDVSMMGSAWRKARLASQPPEITKGNKFYGAPAPLPSLIADLPVIGCLALFSLVLCLAGKRWMERQENAGGKAGSRRFIAAAIGVVGLAWVALFLNNAGKLPPDVGFDVQSHLEYIDYIKTRWRLPLADQSWEMYNPPLYYLLGALLAGPIQAAGFSAASIAALRAFGMGLGIAQVALAALSLRLLFPGRPGAQLFGIILAAALPESLYVSQYVSNEQLCAVLVSAAVYLCLRLLKEKGSPLILATGVGACLGAALLTKFTALVAAPVVFLALLGSVVRRRQLTIRDRVLRVVTPFLTALAICGWHYARVWRRFGTPLVGNWDAASGYHWWMENGFMTSGYFLRFGRALAYPWYSGFTGFLDGLYSTLWGDGMWGGAPGPAYRPPWNHELMATGFVLALVPTLLVLAGAALALIRFLRRPDPAWALLTGLAGATFAAMLLMVLKLPCYAQVKSFYGLIALIPFCAFGALGWETIQRRRRFVPVICATAFGTWATAGFASFWIRGWSAESHLDIGRIAMTGHRGAEAARELAEVRRLDPHNAAARWLLAELLADRTDPAETRREVEAALAEAPDEAECHLFHASLLAAGGDYDAAIAEDRQVIESAPGLVRAYEDLARWLELAGRYEEAAAAARDGLCADPFSAPLHGELASSLASLGRTADALAQFRDALLFKAAYTPAIDGLAWILATCPDPAFRNGSEAVQLASAACTLTDFGDVRYLGTLAAAYAEMGNFEQAAATAQRAVSVAQEQGAKDLFEANRSRLELYQSHRPYREAPGSPAQ
jgi:tetratricopeptide (TPR) repeat protein